MSTLKSMTAYARHAQTIDDDEYVWELRSVNHRYLDAHFRLPERARELEPYIREQLSACVTRGRVDINLSIKEGVGGKNRAPVNPEKVKQWLTWQEQVLAVIPDAAPLSVMQILTDDGVFEPIETPATVYEKPLLASFDRALEVLLKQRLAEGGRLLAVLKEKLDGIATINGALKKNMTSYEQAHQSSWNTRVEKLHDQEFDPVRLHQELALLISKADVTEELDRLDSHIVEFGAALKSSKPVGRRLDFLLQEFNREANTLGSKSMHKGITNASVELKVLIDQLREQIQNIE
jgi:uncharacterized protein (TIGR00255 family)